MNINFRSELESDLPTEAEFNSIPSLELVADEDNADALRRQLILAPAIQEEPVPHIPPAPVLTPYVLVVLQLLSRLHTCP